MKILHDALAIFNIAGSLYGMLLMLLLYTRTDIQKLYSKKVQWIMFACFAFCFFAILREMYTLVNRSLLGYAAWAFKFASSGVFVITIAFYYLITKKFKNED